MKQQLSEDQCLGQNMQSYSYLDTAGYCSRMLKGGTQGRFKAALVAAGLCSTLSMVVGARKCDLR